MCESRGESKGLKKDLAELSQLYHDAQEDIQLLHEALAKQKNCNNSSKAGNDGLDSRQDLISQLEKSQEKVTFSKSGSEFSQSIFLYAIVWSHMRLYVQRQETFFLLFWKINNLLKSSQTYCMSQLCLIYILDLIQTHLLTSQSVC